MPTQSAVEALGKPSIQFRKAATRSILAIFGFILVYIVLMACALGIVVLGCWGGIALMIFKPMIYTILIGAGIIGASVMIFVFLVKFLFATHKTDESDSIEITSETQPELVAEIHAIAAASGTPKPKKIFLSPDVNACVFYNSSFWSLFLPVRKNLKIGLGLVNAVNVSEFKAVLAHEFGHFSQRSMKVGSWVYQVNRILYDMLFNNRGYGETLGSLAQIHAIFAFFASVTVQVVKAIQWVLHGMFKIVNRSYMGLSRQMEFHADLVAASLFGSNHIIGALRRIEFSQASYDTTIELCNKAWKGKAVVKDFFSEHQKTQLHLASINQIRIVDGLPHITVENTPSVLQRVQFKDQWASHPTLEERKEYLEPFGLDQSGETASAWSLFRDAVQLKKDMTLRVYKDIPREEVSSELDGDAFENLLHEHCKPTSFPAVFRDFYDNRLVAPFDAAMLAAEPFRLVPFHAVLPEEAFGIPKKVLQLSRDIAILQAIQNREIDTSSFDFEGQKYAAREAKTVQLQLESELEAASKALAAFDVALFRYCYAIAPLPEAEAYKAAWIQYFEKRKLADQFADVANAMMNVLSPVFQGIRMDVEGAQQVIADLKQNHESIFKGELQRWIDGGAFEKDARFRERVLQFISSDYQYFYGDSFFDTELLELNQLVNEGWEAIQLHLAGMFQRIVDTQGTLVSKRLDQEAPVATTD